MKRRRLVLVRAMGAWAEPVQAWSAALRAAGRAETTIRTRTEHVGWLARDLGGEPWALTTDDLLGWAGSKGWARETLRGVRNSVRSFYGWAHGAGRISVDPSKAWPVVRAGEPRPRPASDEALQQALSVADERVRLMVRLAAEAGLRRAEVAQVHARDLIPDLGGWSLVVHGKGDRERVVPLRAGLASALRAALERAGGGYAFPGDDDGHLSPRWVGKMVTRALPDGVTMHALRHRFATATHQATGGNTFLVQELLGHASPATTRRYVMVPRDDLRCAVESIAA